MTTQPVIIIVIINICTVLNCVFGVYLLRGVPVCVLACVLACVSYRSGDTSFIC